MLRRFETYALAPGASGDAVDRLESAMRCCAAHIPEVLDSAVGWNGSDAPVQLVWEHAFADPAAYRRYMAHPFHATVLDRFILQDSPECVVAPDTLGAGLVGYQLTSPRYRLSSGLRRLVLLRLDAAASPGAWGALGRRLAALVGEVAGMAVSVPAENTLGAAWFDGETPVGPPPRWTHLWEQGFTSSAALAQYLAGGHELAAVERAGTEGWRQWSGGMVRRTAEVHYGIVGPGG